MLEYKYVAIKGERSVDMQRFADISSAYNAYRSSDYSKRGMALSIYNTVTTEAKTYKLFAIGEGNLLSQVARLNTEKLPQHVQSSISWLTDSIKKENLEEVAKKEAAKKEAHKIKYFKADEHPEITAEIVEKIPLVSEVKKDLDLRVSRSGCIFSKSPFTEDFGYSFILFNETRTFKDYAAEKAGNVIDYIQAKNKFETKEDAIKKIINDNPSLFTDDVKNTVFSVEKRIEEINSETCEFYHAALQKDEACKSYFAKRGFTDSIVKKFKLGVSGREYKQILRKHLREKGYTDEEMLLAGVISKSDNGNKHFDFFYDRAMIPIRNEWGKVVAFGGRTLVDNAAKYKNTRTTPSFQKSNVLFNMDMAKKSNQKNILLVEGFMDCISACQSGFDNVVAGCGTAFTDQYAELFKKSKKGVVLCYDNDEAGKKSLAAASEKLKQHGVPVYSIDMSKLKEFINDDTKPSKDFNDLLMVKGPKGLQEFLKSQNAPISLYDCKYETTNKDTAIELRMKMNHASIPYKARYLESTGVYAFKFDERDKERVAALIEKKTKNNVANLPREKSYLIEVNASEAEKLEGMLKKSGIENAKAVPHNYNDKVIFKIAIEDKAKFFELKNGLQNTSNFVKTC